MTGNASVSLSALGSVRPSLLERARGYLVNQGYIATLLWLALAAALFVVVIVPLIFVADLSLRKDLRWEVSDYFSLDSIRSVYLGAEYLSALVGALKLGAFVTVLSVTVGLGLALAVARTDVPQKGLLNLLVIMPMFLSPFNGLIAWLALGSSRTGFLNIWISDLAALFGFDVGPVFNMMTYSGAVWVMFLFFTPYIYLFTVGSLTTMDASLEEASRSCGAGTLKTLWSITLPMCLPAVLAGALLVFILSSETYTIPGVIGPTAGFNVLSWVIYENATMPPIRQAHAAAAATMLLFATIAGILLQRYATRQSEKYVTIVGKGRRVSTIRLGRRKYLVLAFILAYIFLSTILPLGTLILSSFMKYSATTITADLFTFNHYRNFYEHAATRTALTNTVLLAVGAAFVCTIVGAVISLGEIRTKRLTPKLLAFFCVLPVAVPGVVYGIGLQWLYLKTALYGTTIVLFLAFVAKFLPYGLMVSRSSILQVHPELEQCGRVCGAGPFRVFHTITGPLISTGLLSALVLIMLLCIKEISASLILYTSGSTVLSVLTWSQVEAGEYQSAAAIGVVQTLLIMILFFAVRFIFSVRLEQSVGKK